jgi:NACHT domain
MSWLKIDDSDQLAIFDAISSEGMKYPGTGDWILDNGKIKSWLQLKQDTPTLWFQGVVGSGKSVLLTRLVTYMKSAGLSIISHFCTYSYASSTIYEQILKSLLQQLLQIDGDLVAHVYNEHVLGRKPATVAALEQLLHSLAGISTRPFIWIILDGLDECESEKQARVVSLMNQLSSKFSDSEGTIKVLISSRTSSSLPKRLGKKQIISLAEEKAELEGAIMNYASRRLRSLHEKFSQLNIGLAEMDEFKHEIVKKADGKYTGLVN